MASITTPPMPGNGPVMLTPGANISVPPAYPVPRPEDQRPVDLWGNFAPPELPHGVLPPLIEAFAFALSDQMGADAGGLAMAALTVCAGAIPDHVRVQVQEHDARWKESARIWAVLVGLPSTKKSPIITAATAPLAKLDGEWFRDWLRCHAQWQSLDKEAKKDQPEPLQRRLRLGDTTVEAAQEVFRGTDNGLVLCHDELSGWFGALDKYGGGKGAAADRAFWLQAFNGGEMPINRVGRGAVLLPNVSASIIGGIQPDAIRRIAGDSVDDGLLQRFFPIILRPGEVANDAPVPGGVDLYGFAVRSLTALNPVTLQFDAAAHELRRDVVRRHHGFGSGEAASKMLGAHIGKLDGLFARLCIVWHAMSCPWGPPPLTIPVETAAAVERFMRVFLLPHASAFYLSTLGLGDDHDRLEAVAGYILAQKLAEIDHRTVQRSIRSARKLSRTDTRPLFETLSALNWLLPSDDPAKRTGEPRWFVNPHVHAMFAERAEQEHCRRLQARATLIELSGQRSGSG